MGRLPEAPPAMCSRGLRPVDPPRSASTRTQQARGRDVTLCWELWLFC